MTTDRLNFNEMSENITHKYFTVLTWDRTVTLCKPYQPVSPPFSPVKVGFDLEQIAIECFLALTCLLGPSNEHIKSLHFFDIGKVVNLHIQDGRRQSFNIQITFFLAVPGPYKCTMSKVELVLHLFSMHFSFKVHRL